jgi:hypothetical protein
MATKAKAKKTTAKTNGTNKTQAVVKLMRRAKGVTRPEVLALTNWQAVSMQAVARAACVKIKLEKIKGQPIVYRCIGS